MPNIISGKNMVLFLVLCALALSANTALAQVQLISGDDCADIGVNCKGEDTAEDLKNLIVRIVNVFLVLAGIAAAIFIIIGGIQYIFSRGDESIATKAKMTILYALIGLVVIGLAAAIVNFTVGAIRSGGGNQGNNQNQNANQ